MAAAPAGRLPWLAGLSALVTARVRWLCSGAREASAA